MPQKYADQLRMGQSIGLVFHQKLLVQVKERQKKQMHRYQKAGIKEDPTLFS